jgi:prolyl-tRNA synthetase
VLEYFGAGEGGTAKTGFARVHVADDAAVTAALDPLKVTVRCVPMEGPDEPGTCVFTGRPVARPSILARAY